MASRMRSRRRSRRRSGGRRRKGGMFKWIIGAALAGVAIWKWKWIKEKVGGMFHKKTTP